MITVAVRWNLRYSLSDRDVEELSGRMLGPPEQQSQRR